MRIRHDGGVVTDAPGLYVLGTPVLRRRKSTYIHGAVDDTFDLAAHVWAHLDGRSNPVRRGGRPSRGSCR
jgi:putative flavoprotein involved in K+ transport